MSEGQIIERGTHAALLLADGQYAKMWTIQQQEKPE
jgi:ATP-binding cassette subfamily B protein